MPMSAESAGTDADDLVVLEDRAEEQPVELLPVGFVVSGKYVIKRVLGSGGNGAVYESEHTTIGHRVAIKVARLSQGERAVTLERFRREARICGSLRHANVGQVFDVGMLDDGAPYMVMELQEGRSLGDIFDEMRLPIVALIDITRQLLAGLAATHQAGIVHCDVKPDNVMIVRDANGEVVVKLVDFGISKGFRADRDGSTTHDDDILGSPDYMAPEQLRGGTLDPRADLYAVGVLLYEGITGRLPFDGTSMADLLVSVLHGKIEPPTALRADCPPELEHLVLTAMAREPAARPHSADQMARALAQLSGGTRHEVPAALTRAREQSLPGRSRRSERRRTADLRTLQDLGAQVETRVRSSRGRRLRLIGTAAVTALGLLALLSTRAAPAPEPVAAAPAAKSSIARPADAVKPQPAAELPAQAAEPRARAKAPAPALREPKQRRAAARAARAQRAVAKRAPVRTSPAPVGPRVAAPAATTAADATATQALLKEAAAAFVRGEAGRARELYRQVAARDPRRAEAYRGIGLASSRLGKRAEAARAFEHYLRLRPNAPDAARIRDELANLK